MAEVEFFYDVASPYSYLAATRMTDLAARTGATIRWRPFLLGGVFKATGNKPPATVPARARYLLKDLHRWAAEYGVDFAFPSAFPVNSITAQRALVGLPPDERPAASLAVFRAYWVDGRDPSDPEVLADVLGPDALVRANDPSVKDRLRQDSDEAVARGAYGAPTFFVGDEMFFGNDRLHHLEAFLARG